MVFLCILSETEEILTVQAFRKLYEAVDLGWVYAITKYEPVSLDLISLVNVLTFGITLLNIGSFFLQWIGLLKMCESVIHRLQALQMLFTEFGLNTVFK